jgi:hypothetical protein
MSPVSSRISVASGSPSVSTTKPRTSSGTASASQIASPNKRAGRAATCVPACSASCQPPPSVYIRRRRESRTDWRSKRTRCRTRPAAPRRIPVRCGGRSGIRLLPQGLAPFHDFCATTYDRSSSVTAHAWSDDGRPTPTDLSRSGSTPAKTPTAEDRRRVHRPGCRRRPAIPAEHARAIYREGSGDHDLDR